MIHNLNYRKYLKYKNLQSLNNNYCLWVFSGAYQFDDILSLGSSSDIEQGKSNQHKIQPDDACNIQFTSGTTGQPKAAVISHYSFVNNGIHIANRTEMKDKAQRICVQVPLFHAFGVVISIMTSIAYGSTMVLPARGFDPEASAKKSKIFFFLYFY